MVEKATCASSRRAQNVLHRKLRKFPGFAQTNIAGRGRSMWHRLDTANLPGTQTQHSRLSKWKNYNGSNAFLLSDCRRGCCHFISSVWRELYPGLETKVKYVGEEILSNRLDNKWSVKENIGHLAEVDEVANRRIDEMIAGISPLSPAVFEPKPYHELPVQEVINFFREARSKNIKRYKALSPSDLEKTSLHPRLKVMMSPVDLAWFDAEHDDHHLVRISEILLTLLSKNQ